MIKKELEKIIQKMVGNDIEAELSEPPNIEMGDFSFACFELAKKKKESPVEAAKKLSGKINQEIKKYKILRQAQAVGPYVNFFVDRKILTKEILTGKLDFKKKKTKIVLDVFQANPLKAFHIGHLFNAILGESIRRLLKFVGYRTVTYSYSGDVGMHIARWLWYFQNFYKGKIPEKDFTKWAGEIYAKASAKIKEKPEYQETVNQLNQLIARRDKSIIRLWRKLIKLSYRASWGLAKELECRVDYSFPESVCEGPGKKIIQKKIKAGIIKQDQGAWGVDLGEKLGFFILLKSDGTALYQTKDLGLAELRNKKIGNYQKCLLVVGSEQEHYFRQLFKTFELLNHSDAGKCEHVPHGLVSLKQGKMASRSGNVITYAELRDETIKKVLAEINKRNSKLKNKNKTAEIVALAALKFSMLQHDRLKNTKFDWQSALSFEGNSGPYLQYTYARIESIIKKSRNQSADSADKKSKKIDYNLLTNIEEARLVKVMGKFGKAIEKAAENYQPYILANYLLDLASEFNHFYHQCRVIDSENLALSRARLVLINKVAEILKQGLELLGIGTVEEM